MKLVDWWGKGVFLFLFVSILMLGVGDVEWLSSGVSFSAWSLSRTTFFFWLVWKFVAGIQYGRKRLSFKIERVPIPLLVFFVLVTVSLLPTFRAPGDYRYFFFGCMHYLMVVDLFSPGKRTYQLYLLLALVPGFLVVRGLLNNPAVLNLHQMVRFGYPLDHPNTAGYLFSMSIPLALVVLVAQKSWRRVLPLISLGLQMLGLLLTYSRGAWLGSGASLVSFGIAAKKQTQVLTIFAVALVTLVFATPFKDRLLTLLKPEEDAAIIDRMRVMKDSFQLGLKHPVLGIGYGRGRLKEALRERYQGTANEKSPIWHAHNVYVELFAETGLLGLGAFLWVLWDVLYRTWQKAIREQGGTLRVMRFGLLAALIAFSVTGLGDVPFYHHETRIYFFTLLALAQLYLEPGVTG